MLRVGLLIVFVCLALSTCAASQKIDGCGPLYLDPNTLGGLGRGNALGVCDGTFLHFEGAHDAINVKGWRPLQHMEWFGILPNCSQVALGVSVNRNVEGGLRGNANSVGIFYGSNKAYWGFPETPTIGGLNQDFTEKLAPVGKKSRGHGMWIMVNYETGLLWYAKTGMEPISVGLPETFKGRALYPHVEAWESNYVEVLHASPVLSFSCPLHLQINKDTFTAEDPGPFDPGYLADVEYRSKLGGYSSFSSSYAQPSAVKASWVLDSGRMISVDPHTNNGDYGIGVSIYPFKAGIGMVRNPYSIGFRVGRKSFYGWERSTGNFVEFGIEEQLAGAPDDPNNSLAGIKVDYAKGKLQYAHPKKSPIEFDLPETFKGKPLFPFIQVWGEGEASFKDSGMGAK